MQTVFKNFCLVVSIFMSVKTADAQSQSPHLDRTRPPELGPLPPFTVPRPERFRLANGLEIAFVARSDTGLADANLSLETGACDDPPGLFGLADWTGSLLNEGAGSRDALEFADAVDFLGARVDTQVSWDSTTGLLHIPAERLTQGLELLADMFVRPLFLPAELDRLKAERRNAFVEARSEPAVLSHLAVLRAVFPAGSRLHIAVEGTPKSLAKATIEDVRSFHRTHFRPDAAVLTVVGSLGLDEVRAAIEKTFGLWPKPTSARSVAQRLPATLPQKRSILLVDKPGAPQSVLTVAAPTRADLAPLDAATEVVNTVLGGAFTSRLNMNLREKHGYTYGAHSSFEFWAGGGMFRAGAAVETPVTAPAVAQTMKELAGIRVPMEASELSKARTYRAVTFPTNFESGRHTADVFGWAASLGIPDIRLQMFVKEVETLDVQAVSRAAERAIDPDQLCIVIVGDRKEIEAPIRALGLGELSVRDVDEVIDEEP